MLKATPTGVDYLGLVWPRTRPSTLARSPSATWLRRPTNWSRRLSSQDAHALGLSLRLQPYALSKTIPANMLCERASHQEAVARIRFCIAESLFGVMTGEVGVGKTVAVRPAT